MGEVERRKPRVEGRERSRSGKAGEVRSQESEVGGQAW